MRAESKGRGCAPPDSEVTRFFQSMEGIGWRADRLPEAVAALCQKAGLPPAHQTTPVGGPGCATNIGASIEWHAKALGCEAETLHSNLRDLDDELPSAYPAILQIGDGLFVAVVDAGKRTACLLTPELKIQKVLIADLVHAIREPDVQALREPLQK